MKQDMEYYTTGEEIFNKAVEDFNNERYLEAIDGFYEVLQSRDRFTFASWVNIARSYINIKRFEDAINPLRKVLTYDGNINGESSINAYKLCYTQLKSIMCNMTYTTYGNKEVVKKAEENLQKFLNNKLKY